MSFKQGLSVPFFMVGVLRVDEDGWEMASMEACWWTLQVISKTLTGKPESVKFPGLTKSPVSGLRGSCLGEFKAPSLKPKGHVPSQRP